MNKRFSGKARDSVLGGLVEHHITDGSNLMNALEFIESPGGLGITLYPVQRVIVKLIFGIPMDWNEHEVPVHDMFCDELLYTFKETEYIRYVYEDGRINIPSWQDANPDGYNEIDMIVGRRGGKLLAIEEPIPTPKGFVRNGDLKTGDEIFGEDGQIYKIRYAHPPERQKAYKVSFDDGTSVYAHAGHLWHTFTRKERKNSNRRRPPKPVPVVEPGYCQCGCGNLSPVAQRNYRNVHKGQVLPFIQNHSLKYPRIKQPILGGVRTTEEIYKTLLESSNPNKPPQANHSIALPKPIDLPSKELPLDPYCLGAWLGDGHTSAGRITGIDPEILEEFSKAGYLVTQKSHKEWAVAGLTSDLRKVGVFKNKHIPHDYLWGSAEQRLALLQGLMDTDGSCMQDGQCEFSNTNKDLAEGVYHLTASLGLKPYWSEKFPVCTNGKNGKTPGQKAYLVRWTGELPVFRLKRKLLRLPKTLRSTQKWRYIINVEPLEQEMEMRCITVDNPSGLYLFGKNFNTTHNSAIVGAVAAYKLYRLLSLHSPQDYYGLVPGSPIDITMMAQDGEGSNRLYDQLKNYVNKAPFFTPFVKGMGGGEMTFVSEADRGKRDITPSIKAASYACTTNAVRGPSSYFLALDEFAFYRNQIGSNSDEMYEAATPATMQFKAGGTREGKRESMIFIITSPGNKIGKYYTLFRSAMDEGPSSPVLAFQCSTSEMNPRSDAPFLKQQYKENPEKFMAEYGGKFLEASETYVKNSTITECVEAGRKNVDRLAMSMIGHKYFWGLDLGMKHDATALSVCHWEGGQNQIKLVFDYIDRIMVGQGKYEGFKELPLDDVLTWIKRVNDMIPCFKGATDQYGGSILVQLLTAHGVSGMDLVHLTGGINSQMYLTLKMLMENRQVSFPDNEDFMNEMRLLEASYTNKYQIRVAAPDERGAHDDMADSTALAAYMAQTWAIGEGNREIGEIMMGISQNRIPGHIEGGGWDNMASMSHLKSVERQVKIAMNPFGSIQNPWRKR